MAIEKPLLNNDMDYIVLRCPMCRWRLQAIIEIFRARRAALFA